VIKNTRAVAVVMIMTFSIVLSGCASDGVLEKTVAGSVSGSAGVNPSSFARRGEIRMQLAIGYYEQGQFATALEELERVIQLTPHDANAYAVRALVYMAQGELQLAENNFLHALKLSPNHPDFANNYGLLLCRSGRMEQSLVMFDHALSNAAYRTPAVAANNVAMCSVKLNDMVAAKRYFERSLQYDPAGPLANAYLAKWSLERQDLERARFHIGFLENNTTLSAEVLWLAIKVERQLDNKAAEKNLATILQLRYPTSSEYAAYQRGAFDE
jgi:type IV pilus assembly protein PilF